MYAGTRSLCHGEDKHPRSPSLLCIRQTAKRHIRHTPTAWGNCGSRFRAPQALDIDKITGALPKRLTIHSTIITHCPHLHSRIAIQLIVASEITGIHDLRATTKKVNTTRDQINVLHGPLIRESADLPFNPASNINEQAAKPGDLGLKRRMILNLLHELLVEGLEMDDLFLEQRRVGLLLLPVLPDGGPVPRGAALLGGSRGGVLGGGLGAVGGGRDDLGVDVDTGVGVGEVMDGRVAGVRVGAGEVLRVLEDLVEVAVHGAGARGLGAAGGGARAQVRVRVEIEVPVVHGCNSAADENTHLG